MTQKAIKSGRLTLLCADLNASPLFWTEDDRQRSGYEPEVAQAVANKMGLSLDWKFCRWSDFGKELKAGEADAIWCGCAITPERSQQFLFSKPYAVFNESVLVRSNDAISDSEDLVGLRVGAIAASTNMTLAEQWPGCELVGFDGTSDNVFKEMVDALSSGEIDAVVDDEPAFGGLLSGTEFKIAFTVHTANYWGAAMHRDSFALKQAFDFAIHEVIDSDELARIWTQHLGYIKYPKSELLSAI